MMWRPVSAKYSSSRCGCAGPGPVRPEEGAERMVERLHVDADELDPRSTSHSAASL